MRQVKVMIMTKEEYMNVYGDRHEEGELFDYPLEEMSYILLDTKIEKLALIEGRLYEIE